ERALDIARQIVEQHIADASARHDADRRPYQKVVDVLRPHRRGIAGPERRRRDEPARIPPGEQAADYIAKAVPVDRKGSDRDDHRIDIREGDGGYGKEIWDHGRFANGGGRTMAEAQGRVKASCRRVLLSPSLDPTSQARQESAAMTSGPNRI